MKILHITTLDFGGAGVSCLRIHQSLLALGIESKVVTLKKTKKTIGVYQYGYYHDLLVKIYSVILRIFGCNKLERNKIHVLYKKYRAMYSLPVSSINLLNNEWIEWADIIHLHWVNNYLDYPSFFKNVNKPIVWTLHDENLFYGIAHLNKTVIKNHPLEIKYRNLKTNAVKSAKNLSVVFLSKMMYDRFEDEEIIKGRDKTVINNSVDTKIFRLYNRTEMREKYGIKNDSIVFAFVSMDITDPNKGLNVLSEVLLSIDPQILIMAIGENRNKCVWKNVIPMGSVKDSMTMSELLSVADYYAMPSLQEAFPLSPMEAMSCGIPVVLFPVSGSAELVNEKNGIISDDFTSDSLRRSVMLLMKQKYNPEIIRQDMIERFSPVAIANKYINLYSKLLDRL